MKKLLSGLCVTALGASIAITGLLPAQAAPLIIQQPAAAESYGDVVQVQSRWERRQMRRNFRERDRPGWYRGYRGVRHHRPGYRRHGDFWFPLAAFTAGALITGAIQNQPRVVERRYVAPRYLGNAHVEWCYNRYRSYRASDNTFQPYEGPRRQCYSPYD